VIAGTLGLLGVALALHLATAWGTASAGQIARDTFGAWFLPVFMIGLLLVGLAGGVRVYEVAIEGAREALEVAVRIVPFLVLILVAIAMLRRALDALVGVIDPVTSRLGFPAEALPMAPFRPSRDRVLRRDGRMLKTHGLTRSSAYRQHAQWIDRDDVLCARRLAPPACATAPRALACLGGDLAGFVMATAACHWFFGP
jgi:hypothetical protein